MRLIDADALKVDYLFPTTTTGTKCYQYVSMEQIQNAPTIEPEPSEVARDIATIIENEKDMRVIAQPRKGKWIAVHDPVFADTYYCSECKEEPLATDTVWVLSNFCPNCGADMRGEQDG